MAPDWHPTDVVATVRGELERHASRVRNGLHYLAGRTWAPEAPTPSTVVWRSGAASVRRYHGEGHRRHREPVLAFTGLVSKPYCFDLAPGNSVAQFLSRAGFDVFVLDWGVPGAADSGTGLESYLADVLPRALTAVLDEADADLAHVMGYCMGGNMALVGLAAEPRLPVRSLVVMTTAVDFREMGPFADALRDGRIQPESVLDASGNVPAGVIESAFKVRRPTADVVQYVNLLEHLWDDEYLVGYQAMARWVREHVPMAGTAFRQVAEEWVVANGFLEDRLTLGGRRVHLADIAVPTLAVIAERDDLVPMAAARAITAVLTGTDVTLVTPDTGHTGLVTGRTAARETLPQVFDWLAARSEEWT